MMKKRWVKSLLAILLIMIMVLPSQTANAQVEDIQKKSAARVENNDVVLNNDMVSMTSTNSFGKMVEKSMTEYNEDTEENSGNKVFSVEVSGTSAKVSFQTAEDCKLIVGIYSEDGTQLLAVGEQKVSCTETETNVTIDTDSMPDYFYIRANLVSSKLGCVIGQEYTSPMYTQEMQEFLEKTTDDFDEELIMNLDGDNTNNFGVYNSDVKIIQKQENQNLVESADEAAGTYVISNIDEQISNLQTGDIFTYDYEDNGEEETLIVKVADIDIDGTTATITEDEDIELDDVFSYLKVDSTSTGEGATVDTSENEGFFEYKGEQEDSDFSAKSIDIDMGTSHSFNFETDKELEPFAAKFSMKFGLNLKIYIGFSHQYVEFKGDVLVTGNVTATSKFDLSEIVIAKVKIPIVQGIFVDLKPYMDFTGKVEVELNAFTWSAGFGFAQDTDGGYKDLSSAPKLELAKDLKLKGEVSICFKFETSLVVISEKIASAGVTASAAIVITASKSVKDSLDDSHACKMCVAGNIMLKFNVTVEVKFKVIKSLTYKHDILPFNIKLCDFYYSFDRGDGGIGTCPYKKYKITLKFKDQDHNVLTDTEVNWSIDGQCVSDTTDSSGAVQFPAYNGNYSIIISVPGYREQTLDVIMDSKSKVYDIVLEKDEDDEKKDNSQKEDDANQDKDTTGIAINATNFPDTNFRTYVQENFDFDSNQYLNEEEVNSVTDILVGDSNISNLKGVEYFTNLETLHCGNNNLSSLDVSKNTKLKTLYCYSNSLSSLSISSNSQLEELDCSDNRLTSLTVSNNGRLKGLWCDNNSLSSLNVSGNSNLVRLSCTGNNIKAINISGNSKLEYFACDPDVEVTDSQGVYTANLRIKNLRKQNVSNVKTATYRDLNPNETYMFYVFKEGTVYGKGIEAKDLCYLQQVVADDKGDVSINYTSNGEEGFTKLVGKTIDLKEINGTAKDLQCNGKLRQTQISANYGSYILEEGKDYKVSGDTTAIAPGTYTIELIGIGEFSGTYKINYKITDGEAPIATPEVTVTPDITSTPGTTATPEITSTPGTTATTDITSTPEATATPELFVKKITLSGSTKKVAAGKKIKLTATVWPKDAVGELKWTSSMPSYASVNQNGVVTTKKAGIGSKVIISAVALNGYGISASYEITIMKDAVKSVKLKAASKTVKAGKKVKIKATVKTTGNEAYKTVKWTSSNTKYATVNSKGVVTTKKAGKGKTVKITAVSLDGTNKKATVKIKIK